MNSVRFALPLAALALAGCAGDGDLDVSSEAYLVHLGGRWEF